MQSGKVLSIHDKKTKPGDNSRHVHVQFDLGFGCTKIADVNIWSIQAAPEEEGNTAEEQSVAVAVAVAVAEEQVSTKQTVNDGGTDDVAVTEDNATPVEIDVSSTDDTILNTAQSLLDDMNINDDNNEGQNAVGGGDTEEKAPNTTETNKYHKR